MDPAILTRAPYPSTDIISSAYFFSTDDGRDMSLTIKTEEKKSEVAGMKFERMWLALVGDYSVTSVMPRQVEIFANANDEWKYKGKRNQIMFL